MPKTSPQWRPHQVDGFDRVEAWFDHASLPIDIAALRRHCRDLKLTLGQMYMNACWKLKLTVFQPSRKFFKVLHRALGLRIRLRISYVEIARDVLARHLSRHVMRECLASMVVSDLHSPNIIFCGGTAYYRPRVVMSAKSNTAIRSANVPVVYADKPCKLAREGFDPTREIHPASPPCFHLEWRCSGSAAVRAAGIGSLADLIDFDHDRFWNQRVWFLALPEEKTTFGRLLSRKSATDDGYLKRANRFVAKYLDDGKFLMHDAVRATPGLAVKLRQLTFDEMVTAAMADVPSFAGLRV